MLRTHTLLSDFYSQIVQSVVSINVPRDNIVKKEYAVIYITSGFRCGRTREPVTFVCTPGVSPPESQLINQRSEQSSIIVTREIPGQRGRVMQIWQQ